MRRAVGVLGRGVERGDLEPGERQVARARACRRSAAGRGRRRRWPWRRARRSGWRRWRGPWPLAVRATPWPGSDGAERDVGVDRAAGVDERRAPRCGAMSGASSVSRPSTGAAPVCESSPVSRFGPTATSRPESARLSPATARSAASSHHQPVERAVAGERAGDVGAVDLAGEAEPGAGEAAAHELALGDARREGDVDRAALAGGAALGGERCRARAGRGGRGRSSAASKPMSVLVLEIWPFEAKESCGLARRRSSVRKPPSSRTARPERVVSPAISASRRSSPSARSVVSPSKLRSKPPLSGLTLPSGVQVDRAAERAVRRGRRRSPRSATRMALRPVKVRFSI